MFLAEGENARDIVLQNGAQTIEIAKEYHRLSNRLNIDFGHIIELFDYIPLFQNGSQHKETRKRLAASYSVSRAQQEKNISVEINRIGEIIRSREGLLDVIEEVARPLWMSLYISFCQGVEIDDELMVSLPNIFCPGLSIRNRILINKKLVSLLDRNRSKDRRLIFEVAALSALGFRPLVYGLALSLYKCCSEQTGLMMRDMEFPKTYSDTPLQFIDRVISDDFHAENVCFRNGDRIRCQTYSNSYTYDQNAAFLFGVGRHICLGRSIANYIWKNLCVELKENNKRLLPICLATSQREPFVIVDSCVLEIRR